MTEYLTNKMANLARWSVGRDFDTNQIIVDSGKLGAAHFLYAIDLDLANSLKNSHVSPTQLKQHETSFFISKSFILINFFAHY